MHRVLKIINKKMEIQRNNLPIGDIAEGLDFCYGYDGIRYYVGIGIMGYSLFGTIKATLDEVKQAYNAIDLYEIDTYNIDFDNAKKVLREARKLKLQGDELMHYFGDNL